MIIRITLTAALALALSGCSRGAGDFPSLAKRPIETRSEAIAPAPQPAQQANLDDATMRRLMAAAEEARDGNRAFEEARGPAESAVAAAQGSSVGSEAWVTAQMAVSVLERARTPTRKALADIDDEQRRVTETNPTLDLQPLISASAEVAAEDARQAAILDRLLARLSRR